LCTERTNLATLSICTRFAAATFNASGRILSISCALMLLFSRIATTLSISMAEYIVVLLKLIAMLLRGLWIGCLVMTFLQLVHESPRRCRLSNTITSAACA